MTPREEGHSDGLNSLVSRIKDVIEQAGGRVRQRVNEAMVSSYGEIGRLIMEHEQEGADIGVNVGANDHEGLLKTGETTRDVKERAAGQIKSGSVG